VDLMESLLQLDVALGKQGNARQKEKKFERGDMWVLGQAPTKPFGIYKPTKEESIAKALPGACKAIRNCLEREYPDELADILSHEAKQGRVPPTSMGGDEGVAQRIVISRDLGNPSHYDVFDGSMSVAIWTELLPGDAENWYLVFPNVIHQKEKKAVMIKLFHGVGISWNGRIIRHCTSVTTLRNGNHVFGNFVGSPK